MKLGIRQKGFTIVELLIVIVVIGILAAITIVAYNGVQQRATASATQSDLAQNALFITATGSSSATGLFSSADVMPGGISALKLDATRYKVATYCTNGSVFVLAVQLNNGDEYYSKTSSPVVKDASVDPFRPCDSLVVASAYTTYLNLPTACSGENTTCTFSGTATIVYGSATQGRFNRLANQTGSVGCNNSVFGDPAPGYVKACYVFPN
jgi:prepilin-type N-terminal cleavage/methylation domain-containing protein